LDLSLGAFSIVTDREKEGREEEEEEAVEKEIERE